jgi:hypothetical protein
LSTEAGEPPRRSNAHCASVHTDGGRKVLLTSPRSFMLQRRARQHLVWNALCQRFCPAHALQLPLCVYFGAHGTWRPRSIEALGAHTRTHGRAQNTHTQHMHLCTKHQQQCGGCTVMCSCCFMCYDVRCASWHAAHILSAPGFSVHAAMHVSHDLTLRWRALHARRAGVRCAPLCKANKADNNKETQMRMWT